MFANSVISFVLFAENNNLPKGRGYALALVGAYVVARIHVQMALLANTLTYLIICKQQRN